MKLRFGGDARGCKGAAAKPSKEPLAGLRGSDIGTRMKTTVDIADALAQEAKGLAAREGTTLRELIEAGLRLVLRERRKRGTFRLRDVSFGGNGLQGEFRGADWERIREAAYEGRGT